MKELKFHPSYDQNYHQDLAKIDLTLQTRVSYDKLIGNFLTIQYIHKFVINIFVLLLNM